MKASARVRVSGPLTKLVAGFSAGLSAQGYTDLSLTNHLRLVAHFSGWLEEHEIELHELTPAIVDRYVAHRRRTHTGLRSRRALAPLLDYVGLLEAVRHRGPELDELVERYRAHLVDERGLSAGVVTRYIAVAGDFLSGRSPSTATPADVLQFAHRVANEPWTVGKLSALRSWLRYLHVTGVTPRALAAVVPSTPGWRQRSLPRGLEPRQVRAVLASCDRRTTAGCRAFAVLLLMVRLGLRRCEVAALTLEDIDWANGELVIRGKGTHSRLPLPADIGAALVAYLRRRHPGLPTRRVFLRIRAPHRAATAETIGSLAGQALRRAGVPTGGGHRLRHTAATQMLKRGASLTEIAQVLRHRHIDTTAIYAKVDRDALRRVAQPWPSGDAIDRDRLRTLAQPWPGGAR